MEVGNYMCRLEIVMEFGHVDEVKMVCISCTLYVQVGNYNGGWKLQFGKLISGKVGNCGTD